MTAPERNAARGRGGEQALALRAACIVCAPTLQGCQRGCAPCARRSARLARRAGRARLRPPPPTHGKRGGDALARLHGGARVGVRGDGHAQVAGHDGGQRAHDEGHRGEDAVAQLVVLRAGALGLHDGQQREDDDGHDDLRGRGKGRGERAAPTRRCLRAWLHGPPLATALGPHAPMPAVQLAREGAAWRVGRRAPHAANRPHAAGTPAPGPHAPRTRPCTCTPSP